MTPSPRQLKILKMLAGGKRQKEIASVIGKSAQTVTKELMDFRRQVKCTGTFALLVWAIKRGYLPIKDPPRCKLCGQIISPH